MYVFKTLQESWVMALRNKFQQHKKKATKLFGGNANSKETLSAKANAGTIWISGKQQIVPSFCELLWKIFLTSSDGILV